MKLRVHLTIGYPTASHEEEIDTKADLGYTTKQWKALTESEQSDAVWEYWLGTGKIETWHEELT